MAAAQYDILIEQGATYQMNLIWKDSAGAPINLTGYSARMQLRQTYKSTTPLVSLTNTTGDIVLGGALGTIDVTISATKTAAIGVRSAVYDLELVNPSGFVTRLVQGDAEISPEVTK